MSEKLPVTTPERSETRESRDKHTERENLKKLQERAENASETSKDELTAIKQSIEKAAISGKEYAVTEREHRPAQHSYGSTKELKQQAYKRTIKKAQSRLRGTEKRFSKIIHNASVEKASEAAAKTVARPSGFLFGSVSAFICSVIVLYISKRSGFTYNYLLFVVVFAAGYCLGLIAELTSRLFRKR